MLTPSQTSSAVVPAQKKTGKSKGTKKARAQTQKAVVHLRSKDEPRKWVQVLKGVAIIAGSIAGVVAIFVVLPVATTVGVALASAVAPKATKMLMSAPAR